MAVNRVLPFNIDPGHRNAILLRAGYIKHAKGNGWIKHTPGKYRSRFHVTTQNDILAIHIDEEILKMHRLSFDIPKLKAEKKAITRMWKDDRKIRNMTIRDIMKVSKPHVPQPIKSKKLEEKKRGMRDMYAPNLMELQRNHKSIIIRPSKTIFERAREFLFG